MPKTIGSCDVQTIIAVKCLIILIWLAQNKYFVVWITLDHNSDLWLNYVWKKLVSLFCSDKCYILSSVKWPKQTIEDILQYQQIRRFIAVTMTKFWRMYLCVWPDYSWIELTKTRIKDDSISFRTFDQDVCLLIIQSFIAFCSALFFLAKIQFSEEKLPEQNNSYVHLSSKMNLQKWHIRRMDSSVIQLLIYCLQFIACIWFWK